MYEIDVKVPATPSATYKIKVGADILPTVRCWIEALLPGRNPFIITDRNVVAAGHLEKIYSGQTLPTYIIDPPGETSKNIGAVVSIIEAMEKAYLGRDSVMLALGGGTVGDIAGFAAAIFKRGVPVVQIPTTTVAQADSAVGGKTGVDSSVSKNAYGMFWHPAAVYIDVAVLKSLDDRNYRAGLVESVKHALIADAGYFEFLETHLDDILERRCDVLEQLACLNCRIKARVVEADPTEKNQRRILNYGHTIGHAVESASGFGLLHGEAVAIGIIAAAMIEMEMGLGDQNRLGKVRKMLLRLGMPVKIPANLGKDQLIDIIRRDKKAINKWPRFVVLDRIGAVHRQEGHWAVEVGKDVVEKVLSNLY